MGQYYQKINTIFQRGTDNCILLDQPLAQEEFEALRGVKWEATEKIDGTNMSVHIVPEYCTSVKPGSPMTTTVSYGVEYHGKTEDSQIPSHLLAKMKELFPKEKLIEYFKSGLTDGKVHTEVKIFGEGYGQRIQKHGNSYLKDSCGFILFDVRIGDWWLKREACEKIAEALSVPIVPLIGYMTIDEAIEYVRKGFKSTISEDKNLDAEGLVLKAPCGILTRAGERIITKIKTKDFRQFERKHGKI